MIGSHRGTSDYTHRGGSQLLPTPATGSATTHHGFLLLTGSSTAPTRTSPVAIKSLQSSQGDHTISLHAMKSRKQDATAIRFSAMKPHPVQWKLSGSGDVR